MQGKKGAGYEADAGVVELKADPQCALIADYSAHARGEHVALFRIRSLASLARVCVCVARHLEV